MLSTNTPLMYGISISYWQELKAEKPPEHEGHFSPTQNI